VGPVAAATSQPTVTLALVPLTLKDAKKRADTKPNFDDLSKALLPIDFDKKACVNWIINPAGLNILFGFFNVIDSNQNTVVQQVSQQVDYADAQGKPVVGTKPTSFIEGFAVQNGESIRTDRHTMIFPPQSLRGLMKQFPTFNKVHVHLDIKDTATTYDGKEVPASPGYQLFEQGKPSSIGKGPSMSFTVDFVLDISPIRQNPGTDFRNLKYSLTVSAPFNIDEHN
jgi:hypothetical protein